MHIIPTPARGPTRNRTQIRCLTPVRTRYRNAENRP
jgi:hypothetical protein